MRKSTLRYAVGGLVLGLLSLPLKHLVADRYGISEFWFYPAYFLLVLILIGISSWFRMRAYDKTSEQLQKNFPYYMTVAIGYAGEKRGRAFSVGLNDTPTYQQLLAGLYYEQSKLIRMSKAFVQEVASEIPGSDVSLFEKAEPQLTRFIQTCMKFPDSNLGSDVSKEFNPLISRINGPDLSEPAHKALQKKLRDWIMETMIWALAARNVMWFYKDQIKDGKR